MFELGLDIRTLSFNTVMFSVLYGLGMIAVSVLQRAFAGIRTYALALVAFSCGFYLLSQRGVLPPWLSIVGANAGIILGFFLMHEALRMFKQAPPRLMALRIALLAVVLALLVYNVYVVPSVAMRVMWISLYIAVLAGQCAWVLLRGPARDLFLAQWMTALPFMVAGLYFLFRALWATNETSLTNFMQAGTVHQLAFIAVDVLIITSCFGVLWMSGARLETELRDQARIDPLTRLYNRRALEEIAAREVSRSRRHGLPLSVIVVDIDHFKSVNDTYGHQTGDVVLAAVADVLVANVRAQDVVVRNGGEEFLVLLPGTGVDQAAAVAEKLRAALEATELCPANKVRRTASFGVAGLSGEETWESLCERADGLLYRAKENGRNRVERD